MTVLVTGAAGFIGFHLGRALIERGESVVGVDDLNAYYDPALKRARIDRLANAGGAFRFVRLDIADGAAWRRSRAVTGRFAPSSTSPPRRGCATRCAIRSPTAAAT